MKLRQILVIAAFGGVVMNTVGASPHTITWSAQNPGAALGDAAGGELAPGALVRLGYFAVSPEEVTARFNDVPFLESQFTEVSREQIGNFGGVVYGELVERPGSGLGVSGAFAQTITLESESLPAGLRFYIWVADSVDPAAVSSQGIFSSANWKLLSDQVTALQWGIEGVDPSFTDDLYLGEMGPETSPTVGGPLNKLRRIDTISVGPGDLEDPDGNGIVVLLEEAFLIDAGAPGHASMPYMAAADTLVYNRKSGGESTGWDVYRAGDLEYRVEVTSDFQNWQLASDQLGDAGVNAEALDSGGERVELKLPLSPGPKSGTYFRVHVRRVADEV